MSEPFSAKPKDDPKEILAKINKHFALVSLSGMNAATATIQLTGVEISSLILYLTQYGMGLQQQAMLAKVGPSYKVLIDLERLAKRLAKEFKSNNGDGEKLFLPLGTFLGTIEQMRQHLGEALSEKDREALDDSPKSTVKYDVVPFPYEDDD